ncbi:MAG TPA: Rieske (2Fe-2S) protein [Humibacillus sp.]|nr:Rieske (2Fe-2S) protein [Humibacillus sp.]
MTEGTHASTTHTDTDTDTHPRVAERVARLTDRRGVLRAAVVVAGAGALAACSSPPIPDVQGAPSSGSETTRGATSAAAGGTPTSEIPVGSGKIFADAKIVVTQPTAGTFKAFDAVCPHQFCTVASFEGNQIVCPCHQSHFDITTGDRVSGPAPTGLTPKTITVTGDTFTVS